jgi:hypothetical protein
MTRISAADQIVLLLREQLSRADRARGKPRAATHPDLSPQARLEALAAVDALPDREFRRALLRNLLAEQLGDRLASEPAFETVVGDVLRIIEDAPEGLALLERATALFREPR